MPPKKKQKSSKEKKEDAERQKRLLSTKEKILAIKRMLLSIIETMIEKDVSKQWFITNCTKLCHADYNDVVQERNIENLCGYPLCSNVLKMAVKQKYHISNVTNKVYDLTERKCFCSNHCYKASNYLKSQLSPIPLHMRKEEKIELHLLSECDNRGSVGEEVQFHHTIPQDEIDKVYTDEENCNVLQNMLNEEVKKCADYLADLQIKEHVYEKPYVFGDESSKKSGDVVCNDKSESDQDSDPDSDDSIDRKLFPNHDNLPALSHRHMPIPHKVKKSVLIPPLRSEVNASSPVKDLKLDFVLNVFKDWMTEDTLKYLMGKKYVYGVKADQLFEKMTDSNTSSEKLTTLKDEYINLCIKIDSLQFDDGNSSDSDELNISESTVKSTVNTENKSEKKVFKRRPKRSQDKGKHVTFAPDQNKVESPSSEKTEIKGEQSDKCVNQSSEQSETNEKSIPLKTNETKEESSVESVPIERGFPLIDSKSQNVRRRQVLSNKFKSVFTDLLPAAGLYYVDIREAVRKFVDTLSLTPTNVIFKPKEWKLICLVLFRVLTRTVLKDIHDELKFAKLCEDPSIPIAIDLREIEKLVCDIVSAENIIKLH